jgi:MFS family permease
MKWRELFFEEKKALIIMLGNMVLPFILTGIFIQQSDLAISRGWEIKDAAIAFIFFSFFQIIGNTIFGHLVDKFGAFRLIQVTPISLFVGLFFLKMGSVLGVFYLAMGFLGFTVGIHTSIINAFWAEVYGTLYLGRIKGMDSTMIVLGTSLAPIFFSFVLDKGYSFDFLISFCLFLTLGSLLLFTVGKKSFRKDFLIKKN